MGTAAVRPDNPIGGPGLRRLPLAAEGLAPSAEDTSIFYLARPVTIDGAEVTVADPVHLIWELHTLGGDDRLEAAEKLLAWLLSR